jgi:alpha-glucosidase (family GH31 glycosyl hydrolase)
MHEIRAYQSLTIKSPKITQLLIQDRNETSMRKRQLPRPGTRIRRTAGIISVTALSAALISAPGPTAQASTDAPRVRETPSAVLLTVPATKAASGYKLQIDRSPFQLTTSRGDEVVLHTTGGSPSAVDFQTAAGLQRATDVRSTQWQDGVLTVNVATTAADQTLSVRIAPHADRYDLDLSVTGGAAPASAVALHYDAPASGHWYGHGETRTDKGGPLRDQPWPLDTGKVLDEVYSPASGLMIEPFWFTQKGSGFYARTTQPMAISIGGHQAGVADFQNTGPAFGTTVFVERTAREVYEDYSGIVGAPQKSDNTDAQFRTPAWNSWAQFYTHVTQQGFLDWVQQIHDARIPAETFNLDDGWMDHYGDFTFNGKFPDPKAMSDKVHGLGYQFGLWVTAWINLDAQNYQYAKDHGYLLKSKSDASQPCTVTWWNGTAGLIDMANPVARDWYVGELKILMSQYGVDGFKFDTRWFDERCAPYTSDLTMQDYQKLGAEVADQFDLQGIGVRAKWGSQKYGFATREADKGTSFSDLNAAVNQVMATSTVGYPFVETDMIGGSEGDDGVPPPTQEVLVRWAQAAAAMPLMYASTSPVSVTDWNNGGKTINYDPQTARLYRQAVHLHQALTPYILRQKDRAIATGEPIMKPLFFNYPDDQATYSISDQWLLGDSLLVAPVLSGSTSRDVHVPAGNWYDVHGHRVVHGPTVLHGYSAPFDTLPMFVKLGSADTGTLMSAVKAG